MKKTLSFTLGVIMILLNSCSLSENYKKLEMAEQLMEEQTDSAWHILCSIDTMQLRQGEERALYYLLLTQAQYKLYIPIKSDSLLDYSEAYYNKQGNDYYIANTNYYKGAILCELWKIAESAKHLKKAETHAWLANNELLKNMIYEVLVGVNEKASNCALALKYNKKFLESSILLGDSDLICRAYDGLSFDFEKLGKSDSCRYYRGKCNELLPKAKYVVNRYLANYASDLIKEKKYSQAKHLVLKADSIEHTAYQYNMLAEISLHEGDTIQATEYLEKALQNGDYSLIIQAYKKKAGIYHCQGRNKEAYACLLKADSLTHDYNERVRPIAIVMYQQEFDNIQADLEASRQKNRLLTTLLVVVVLMSCGIIFYLMKVRKLKTVVSKNITALTEAKNEMERLKSSGESREKEISQLNTKIQRLNDNMAVRLGKGKEIFEKAEKREELKHLTAEDEQCFIDYYAYTYAQRFANMLYPYQSPTRRLVTYLIMCDMGLKDKEIQQVLHVSSVTVRSYRHRLR